MSSRLYAFLEKYFFALLCAGFCVIFIAKYFIVAIERATFPFALEWVEGNTFLHVLRLVQGKAIYAPPTYEFIPMIYPPLYYYAAAPLAGCTGNIFLSMRVVSILASLLAFAALYGLCRARGLAKSASFLAVGLFAAAYGLTGFWLDLGRVDSLFMALLLGAAWMGVASRQALFLVPTLCAGTLMGRSASGGNRRRVSDAVTTQSVVTRSLPDLRAFGAAVLLLAALATKQQALVAFPFLALDYLLHRRYRQALVFGGSFLLLAGGWVAQQQIASQGWFWFYTVRLPAAAPYLQEMFARFWTVHLLPYYFPLLLWGAVGLWLLLRWGQGRQALSLGLLVVPMIGMSYLSLVKQWGYVNGLLPAAAGLALAGAEMMQVILLGAMVRYFPERTLTPAPLPKGEGGSLPPSSFIPFTPLLLGVLVCGQFWLLNYPAGGQVPAASNLEAGERLVSRLQAAEEPVFVPAAPYLLALAGKEAHFHASALGDLQLAGERDAQVQAAVRQLQPALAVALSRVRTVILPNARWFDDLFDPQSGYTCLELAGSGEDLSTVSGAISISRLVCLKK